MYKNLKIQERLKKCFTVVTLLASIAGVMGAIMMLIISTQYKHALTNYGFSQGDIGKAMIVFADARSAARGVIGYNDTDMIATMKQIHDEKKQKFDDYWAIVANTCVTGTEKDLYEQVNTLVQQYWDAEAQAMEIGASTDNEDSIKAQQMMNDTVDPLYEQVYSLTADLLDANVNEGDSLAARLSAICIIFLIVIVASIVFAFAQAMRMGSSIAKGIAVPLGALSDRFTTFAKGNLTDPFPIVDTHDEVADIIQTANEMKETLNIVIADCGKHLADMASGNFDIKSDCPEVYQGEFEKLLLAMRDMKNQMIVTLRSIEDASSQVSAGSTNLAEASQSLAEGATEQAGAVEELQATITSITENIEKAADQAHESYVQAKQSWWEDKATIYTQDKDGAYFIYNMPCSEEEYEKLVPGTKIKVTGYKAEWSGEIEVADVSSFEIEDGEYIAEPLDVTDLLGKDELIDHQNELVSFKAMTVEAAGQDADGNDVAYLYNYDGSGSEGDDLYFNVSLNGETYTFTVESYLCDKDSDVYKAVEALNIGDKIDMEGFLYWYEGVNPHITSVTAAE